MPLALRHAVTTAIVRLPSQSGMMVLLLHPTDSLLQSSNVTLILLARIEGSFQACLPASQCGPFLLQLGAQAIQLAALLLMVREGWQGRSDDAATRNGHEVSPPESRV